MDSNLLEVYYTPGVQQAILGLKEDRASSKKYSLEQLQAINWMSGLEWVKQPDARLGRQLNKQVASGAIALVHWGRKRNWLPSWRRPLCQVLVFGPQSRGLQLEYLCDDCQVIANRQLTFRLKLSVDGEWMYHQAGEPGVVGYIEDLVEWSLSSPTAITDHQTKLRILYVPDQLAGEAAFHRPWHRRYLCCLAEEVDDVQQSSELLIQRLLQQSRISWG